jgi:HAD superfamily hydrolase (TIGR01484 family)
MASQDKIAVFDIDGTIAVHGVISESVLAGIRHIQALGYLTTVSTGREFLRVKEVLAKSFEEIISQESLIIVEHGSKIVNINGDVVRADYFEPNEIDHVIDFIRVNEDMIHLLWFTSPNQKELSQIWCKDIADIEAEKKKRSAYAEIFTCSYEELRDRMGAHPISSVSAKLESFVSVENLRLHFTRSEIDVIFQDTMMEFIRNISDKAKAVAYLGEHHDIPVEKMIVAGNAINDVDMLNLPAMQRILVGSGTASDAVFKQISNTSEIIRIDSPDALGLYLQKLGQTA